jgi:hypothetical protein
LERYAKDTAGLRKLYIQVQDVKAGCYVFGIELTDFADSGLRVLGDEGVIFYKVC